MRSPTPIHTRIYTRCAIYKNNDKREKTMYKNKEMKELIKMGETTLTRFQY